VSDPSGLPVPVFLLSLPRSGSTLVQRVLAAHEDVATTPEPWLLLPQFFALRERGVLAPYDHVPAARAIGEFTARLPHGSTDYDAAIRDFALGLYGRAASGATYFVDKTPRYHLIVEDLFRVFPDARFVFLWRNPLAVVASMVETWGHGRWTLGRWRGDLFDGLASLVDGFERHAGTARAVRYEDLVTDADGAWSGLFGHLDLPYDEGLLERFASTGSPGRMGDRTTYERYSRLTEAPMQGWTRTMNTTIRKRWCKDYLAWIGPGRLETMGYRMDELIDGLDRIPTDPRRMPSDVVRTAYGRIAGGARSAAERLALRRMRW
jgi:hypothetical protein